MPAPIDPSLRLVHELSYRRERPSTSDAALGSSSSQFVAPPAGPNVTRAEFKMSEIRRSQLLQSMHEAAPEPILEQLRAAARQGHRTGVQAWRRHLELERDEYAEPSREQGGDGSLQRPSLPPRERAEVEYGEMLAELERRVAGHASAPRVGQDGEELWTQLSFHKGVGSRGDARVTPTATPDLPRRQAGDGGLDAPE